MPASDLLISKDVLNRAPVSKVLGLSGSPRKNGNSDVLLKHILKGVQVNGMSADRIALRDLPFSGCVGCERCRKDCICTGLTDGMSLLYPPVLESKGLVLSCPTHNYNITAWMKAFIDRLYCFYHFDDQRPRGWSSRLAGQGRKAVLTAVCEQKDEADMGYTMEAMRRPMLALGYEIVGELPVFAIFDRGAVKNHVEILHQAESLGAELALALKK